MMSSVHNSLVEMCDNTAAKIAIVIVEVLVVAAINLCAFVPMIASAMFRKIPYFHTKVVSDIPGNPHAFDSAIISMFRTLPEHSNFNIVWTSLPLDEPLIVRGQLPTSRISSLSLYGVQKTDPPNSIDLRKAKLEENDRFEILIAPELNKSQQGLICKGWPRGMMAMRNYLVPPGEAVNTPEIVKASTGEVVRATTQLVSGPATLGLLESNEHKGAIRFLKINGLLSLLNLGVFRCFCWKTNLIVIALGLLLTAVLYQVCFQVGKKGLKKMLNLCKEKNQLYLSTLEQGAKASQPSRLHKYWIMSFDLTSPSGGIAGELSVRGRINRTYQQYWSLVVYDEYGLPLPQYVYDATVTQVKTSSDSSADEYSYDIRMHSSTSTSPFKRPGLTELNVGKVTKGYVLFRLVHPMEDDEKAVQYSSPTVKLIQVESTKSK